MSKPRPWTVASHRPLAPLAEGLWEVDADLDVLPIGRRMVIARLGSGDLVVHNPVACDDTTMAAIESLGTPRYLIVPSGYHGMDAPAFVERYPDLQVVTPAASIPRVSKRVRVDGDLATLPSDPAWRWETLAGVPQEAVFVHTEPAGAITLVFNDAFMNLPAKLPGFKGFVTKLMGSTGGPKVTRTAKWFIVDDKRAYADHLRTLAALPELRRIVVGHGAMVDRDAPAALAAAGDRLAG